MYIISYAYIFYIQKTKRTSILQHQFVTLRFVSLGPLTFFPNGDLNPPKKWVLWVDVFLVVSKGKQTIETWYRNII